MEHPASCDDINCTLSYRDHLLGISISAAAMPTRTGEDTLGTMVREKRWQRDEDAYRRLRKDGLQPPRVDGSALRERQGKTAYDIESRPVTIDYSDPS